MGARILVVNDTEEILDLFRELLEDEGYEPIVSGTAFRDVREVEQLHPDLIILDYIFGTEKLGWQMLQLLKMDRPTARIPIIICTVAIREVRDIEHDLLSRGVRLVPKPFELDELLAAIKSALDAPKTDAYFRATGEPDPQDYAAKQRVEADE
jgi:DNA-binding response OmpR family regulator